MTRLADYLAVNSEGEERAATETWVDLPDVDLNDIHAGMETQMALSLLVDNVDATQDTAGLEGYEWAYKAITQITELPPEDYPALEDYDEPAHKRRALTEAIRAHHDRLEVAINGALEDYTDTFGDSLKTILDSYSASTKELKTSSITVPDTPVRVDSGRIWTMIHVNNKAVADPINQLHKDETALKALIGHAEKVAAAIDPSMGADNGKKVEKVMNSGAKQHLMFNTTVTFNKGKSTFNQRMAPKPERVKTKSDYKSGALWGAGIGTLLFGMFLPGAILGAAASPASGETKPETVGKGKELSDFAHRAAELTEMRGDIEKIADELHAKVEDAQEHKAEVRRQAALVMELLGNIARHIAELLHGSSLLVSKVN